MTTASDNRTVLVVFRATPAERAEIAEYADRYHDGNVSAALRRLVMEGCSHVDIGLNRDGEQT